MLSLYLLTTCLATCCFSSFIQSSLLFLHVSPFSAMSCRSVDIHFATAMLLLLCLLSATASSLPSLPVLCKRKMQAEKTAVSSSRKTAAAGLQACRVIKCRKSPGEQAQVSRRHRGRQASSVFPGRYLVKTGRARNAQRCRTASERKEAVVRVTNSSLCLVPYFITLQKDAGNVLKVNSITCLHSYRQAPRARSMRQREHLL